MSASKQEIYKELSRRYKSGDFSDAQKAVYDELSQRGVFPSLNGNEFDITTEPIELEQKITTQLGEKLTPEEVTPEGTSVHTGYGVIYDPPKEEIELAKKGVETKEGGPFVTRLLSSLANQEEIPTFISERISKDLGYKTQVRVQDEQIQFLAKDKKDPNKMRWTTVEDFGFSAGDIGEILNDIVPAVTETVALIEAAPGINKIKSTPGAIATEGLVVGGAAAATELVRGTLGKLLGVRDEPMTDVVKGALSEGSEAAAYTIGAGAGIGLAQRVMRRSPFNREETEAMMESLQGSDNTVNEINQRVRFGRETEEGREIFRDQDPYLDLGDDLPESRVAERAQEPELFKEDVPEVRDSMFRPDLAQRTGDLTLADKKETIKQGVKNAKVKIEQQTLERDNWKALEDFYDIASGGENVVGYDTASRGVQRAIKTESDKIFNRYQTLIDQAKDETGKFTDKIPELDLTKAAKELRLAAEQERAVVKELEDTAWKAIRQDIGYNPETALSRVKIPASDDLSKTVKELKAETREALNKYEGEQKQRLLQGKIGEPDEVDESVILDLTGKPLKGEGPREYDIEAVNRFLSFLRTKEREIGSGLNVDNLNLRDVQRLKYSLQSMRNKHLADNDPELLKKIQDAEGITQFRASTYDEGIVGKILAKKGNNYYLDDKGTLAAVISSRNGESARAYATAIMGNPQAMQGSRNMIYMLYKQATEEDGVISRKLHDKFMKEYGDTLKPFFRKEDWANLDKLGKLGTVVEKNGARLKELERVFKKNFRGKLQDASPISVAEAVFDKNIRPNDIAKLSTYSKSYGDGLLENYKKEVTRELRKRIQRSGRFNSNAIDDVLRVTGDSTGEPGKLYKLFGPQFPKDLRNLKKAVKMMETRGVAIPKEGESYAVKGAKAAMGPLHPKSRLVTFGEFLRLKAGDKIWHNIIQDPDKLRIVMQNFEKDARTRRSVEIMAIIGLELQEGE